MRGDDVLPDPRLSDDLHTHCPSCAAQAPWVGEVVRGYLWRRGGGDIHDVLPSPTAGAIDAVMLLEREVAALEVAQAELARERAASRRSNG